MSVKSSIKLTLKDAREIWFGPFSHLVLLFHPLLASFLKETTLLGCFTLQNFSENGHNMPLGLLYTPSQMLNPVRPSTSSFWERWRATSICYGIFDMPHICQCNIISRWVWQVWEQKGTQRDIFPKAYFDNCICCTLYSALAWQVDIVLEVEVLF